MLIDAAENQEEPWFRPISCSLTPPGGPLLLSFIGHSLPVSAIAISPDGKRAFSGSFDKTVKLWDLSNGSVIHTLEYHGGRVLSVTFSADGKTALSGSVDTTVKLWDLSTGKVIHTLSSIRKLWESSGDLTYTYEGHGDDVNAVAFSPDGEYALSGSTDYSLKLWNLGSGKVVTSFIGDAPIECLAISSCGRVALAGESNGHLHFLRLEGVEILPQHWAATQMNLGNVRNDHGIRTDGEESLHLLKEAVSVYRQALEVRTRADLPKDWAMTQYSLGSNLIELGKLEKRIDILNEAKITIQTSRTFCKAAGFENYSKYFDEKHEEVDISIEDLS